MRKPFNLDFRKSWRKIASHIHPLRGSGAFDLSINALLDWENRNRIDATGLCSPWEPVSAAAYLRCEGVDRNRYYRGDFSEEKLMYKAELDNFFRELNRSGRSLNYFDNETPKGRNGHLWFFNYQYDKPAWHDYDQDRPVMYYLNDPHVEINPLNGKPSRRRSYREIIDTQRQAGALPIWAHPASWWRDGDEYVTNVAAELPAHLAIDGYLNGMVVSGYDACHFWYQKLWFKLLDMGYVVPGFAENDLCFGRKEDQDKLPLVNYLYVPGELTAASIADAAGKGHCFFGRGGFLTLEVDGCLMGGCLKVQGGRHRVKLCADPDDGDACFSRLEVIGRHGKVFFRQEYAEPGIYEFELDDPGENSYLLARAYGEHDSPDSKQQEIRNFIMTNPVYFRKPGARNGRQEVMNCRMRINSDSPYLGGSVEIISPTGEKLLAISELKPDSATFKVPAGSAMRVTAPDGEKVITYPYFEDSEVQELVSYLSEGRFLETNPELKPGEVPPEAFRIEEFFEKLGNISFAL